MTVNHLIGRGLVFYWRTHAAVVVGVATAVAVLCGALLVGDSVRGSLRDLLLLQLGRTDRVVVSTGFFREALAGDLQDDASFGASFEAICPLIVAQGAVTEQATARLLAVADGGTASVQLRRLLIDQTLPPDEAKQTRAALKAYCAVDTLGVVRLLERLGELAARLAATRAYD